MNLVKKISLTVFVLFILSIFFGTWTTIKTGERGVVTRFGKVQRSLDQGLHFKIPLIESVDKTNVQTQKEQTEASAASSDLQNVRATVAVNWNVQPDKVVDLYVKVGSKFGSTIIDPAIQEVVKAVTAKYTAEELITKRPQVTEDIQSQLYERLISNDIVVTSVSIVNFDFSESFNEAIEAKVTAEQQALAQKNKLEQVKYEAEQRVVQSKAEAEAIKIQAEALKENNGLVELEAVKKWNGVLPTTVTNGSIPFLNLK